MDFDLDDPVLLEQNAKIQAKAKKQPKAGKKGATFDSGWNHQVAWKEHCLEFWNHFVYVWLCWNSLSRPPVVGIVRWKRKEKSSSIQLKIKQL